MSSQNSPWAPVESEIRGRSTMLPAADFVDGVPLGGSAPPPLPTVEHSDRKDLVLAGILFISSLVAAGSTLMPWRDYAWKYTGRAQETGWSAVGGSLGRGWITILCAVAVAVAGVLIAAARTKPGRVLAVVSGLSLMVAAVCEWGFGDGGSRNGPGLGLWVELVAGALVVMAVGVIEPSE